MAPPRLPDEVLALLGPSPEETGGRGRTRVLRGEGRVAKAAPPDAVERERWILAELAPRLPLAVPSLLGAGPTWLLLEDVPDRGPWTDADVAACLGDLAALHGAFAGDGVLGDPRLRDPLGRDLDDLMGRARRARSTLVEVAPGAVAALDDPRLVLDELAHQPRTLLHGDPWPLNVRRPPAGSRVWIDWGHAGSGPAALDVATWIDQARWGLPWSPHPDWQLEVYATEAGVPVEALQRAVDAASVFWFLVVDAPALRPLLRSDRDLVEEVVAGRRPSLERLGLL